MYVVMTDEAQILCIAKDHGQADLMLQRWEANHAASGWIVECEKVQGLEAWRPILPPNSDIDWALENFTNGKD